MGAFGEAADVMEKERETGSKKNLKIKIISRLIKMDLYKVLSVTERKKKGQTLSAMCKTTKEYSSYYITVLWQIC